MAIRLIAALGVLIAVNKIRWELIDPLLAQHTQREESSATTVRRAAIPVLGAAMHLIADRRVLVAVYTR